MRFLVLVCAAAGYQLPSAPTRRHHGVPAPTMVSTDSSAAADELLDSFLLPDENAASLAMRRRMAEGLRQKQIAITNLVGAADGTPFLEDAWTRPNGGGGVTRVLAGGNVWEKAGVALSIVYGASA